MTLLVSLQRRLFAICGSRELWNPGPFLRLRSGAKACGARDSPVQYLQTVLIHWQYSLEQKRGWTIGQPLASRRLRGSFAAA